MKHLLSFCLIVALISCQDQQKKTSSIKEFTDSLKVAAMADSMTNDVIKNAMFDTVGISAAPVKIISAHLVKREYSNYKDISITYKNVSDKKISAIRFKWYGLNAFGEPADMGTSLQEGFGSGFDDEGLRAGRTTTNQWEILSSNAKKIVLAWPYEVVFEDDSKWESSNR